MESTSYISMVLMGISILILVFAIVRLYIAKAWIGVCCTQEYGEHLIFGFTCMFAILLAVLGFAIR